MHPIPVSSLVTILIVFATLLSSLFFSANSMDSSLTPQTKKATDGRQEDIPSFSEKSYPQKKIQSSNKRSRKKSYPQGILGCCGHPHPLLSGWPVRKSDDYPCLSQNSPVGHSPGQKNTARTVRELSGRTSATTTPATSPGLDRRKRCIMAAPQGGWHRDGVLNSLLLLVYSMATLSALHIQKKTWE